jgi:hypothetical protein
VESPLARHPSPLQRESAMTVLAAADGARLAGRAGRARSWVGGPQGRGVHRTDDHVRLSGETGHGIQRHHVADPREEHLGAEQREETVGGGAPTGSRLGEVLQAGECQEALAAAIFLYPWTVAH